MSAAGRTLHTPLGSAIAASAVFALWAAVLAGTLAAGSLAARASVAMRSSGGGFTLYSVSSQAQFVNHRDDLERGKGNNPFGNYFSAGLTPPPNEKLFGPFALDEGEFAFTLYSKPDHHDTAGSAIFLCQYTFNENAFCDAAFQLSRGSLIGAGAFNFNSSTFELAIQGGTYKYRGTKGQVDVVALGTASQPQPVYRAVPLLEDERLSFVLRPS